MRDDEMDALLREDNNFQPGQAAKEQAISAALRAFDEKNARSRQGFSLGDRLIHSFRNSADWIGENLMKTSYALAGSVCLAALAVLIVNQVPMPEMAAAQKEKTIAASNAEQDASQTAPAAAPVPMSAPPAEAILRSMDTPEALRAESKAALAGAGQAAKKADVQMRSAQTDAPAGSYGVAAPQTLAKAEALGSALPAPTMNGTFAPSPQDSMASLQPQEHRDKFSQITSNSVKLAAQEPVSTFSIDVDTASYSFVRAALNANRLPPKDAVRIEEMVNYFPYEYDAPKDKAQPFLPNISLMPTPWNKQVGSSRVDLQACKLEYSIVSPK